MSSQRFISVQMTITWLTNFQNSLAACLHFAVRLNSLLMAAFKGTSCNLFEQASAAFPCHSDAFARWDPTTELCSSTSSQKNALP